MDFCKQIYHGEENDEGYLVVVVEFTGTRRTDRKSSPECSPEKFTGGTSALDLEQTEWRLEIGFVLLESAREGERRHIYRSRVWKSFKIINFGIFRNSFSVQK